MRFRESKISHISQWTCEVEMVESHNAVSAEWGVIKWRAANTAGVHVCEDSIFLCFSVFALLGLCVYSHFTAASGLVVCRRCPTPHCPLPCWGAPWDELRTMWEKPGLLSRGARVEMTNRLWRALGSRDMWAVQCRPSGGMPRMLGRDQLTGQELLLLSRLRVTELLAGEETSEGRWWTLLLLPDVFIWVFTCRETFKISNPFFNIYYLPYLYL